MTGRPSEQSRRKRRWETTREGARARARSTPTPTATAALIVLLLVAWESLAVAQPVEPASGAHLVLDVTDCGEREPAVRGIVAVEVGDLLLDRGIPGSDEYDRLSIVCSRAVASIEARAAASPTGGLVAAPVRRTIELAAFPGDAAARALALAGLEILAEVSPVVQRRLQTRARVPAVASPAGVGPASAAAAPAPPLRVAPLAEPPAALAVATLSGAYRGFGAAHGASLWGARAAVDRGIGRRWAVELDLEVASGARAINAGSVSVGAASLGGFWGLRGSAGPHLAGVVAAGGRLGVARLGGHVDDPARFASESIVRPWAGPAVLARALLGWGRWAVTASAEAGVAVRGAEGVANGDTAVALRGMWVALGMGFGIRQRP